MPRYLTWLHLYPAVDYEARYRKAVADRLDFVHLFGIDVPKESKEYSLSVAYVTLNLRDEDADEETEGEETEDAAAEGGRAASLPSALPAEQVFDNLGPEASRLLIRGPAGCGKTTLLRWAAVQAGRGKTGTGSNRAGGAGPDASRHVQDPSAEAPLLRESAESVGWRQKVPFLIRLRDCPEGRLPRPCDFPLLLAKELPDPPHGWTEAVLGAGDGLVMFDGADEVRTQARDEVVREIRQLMQIYPDNYYVLTTRPEAIDRLEFRELAFLAARVEPMSPRDRDTFIDRWHEAMEVRLRNWGEPVDLRPLAGRLKQRLEENPAIARLTVNPLLCAVVGGSWWEAEAFCRWASGALPTEDKWEAAARGPDGLNYPWGDKWEEGECNSGECQLGSTSAVGIFRRDKSPFGLHDMAGNVWEWCADLWQKGAALRVFRGGSPRAR